MSPETALRHWPDTGILARIMPAWRLPLLQLSIAALALLALFWRDWLAMADQWWNSSTYNHILFVPAILVWLVSVRVQELARLQPRAWWPGLFVIAGALLMWLLGALAGVNVARQLGAIAMVQGAVVTLLGPRVSAGLIFPLFYALFLVPFGDELVPALQLITAKLTIAFTHMSGIAAQIDGVFIDTPAGLFEVAEACSGVKFLVAMVALGVFVSHVSFTSRAKRAAFLAVCVVMPIIANGIRAWGTIYIAQFQGIEFAAGLDHIIYGWIFFAIVMGVTLALSWRFFDRAVDDHFIDAGAIGRAGWLGRLPQGAIRPSRALAAIAVLAFAGFMWEGLASRVSAPMPANIALPDVPGWHRADYTPEIWWEPRANGADHRLLGSYRDFTGRRVEVFFALYAAQDDGREAGGYGQGALIPESDWRWLEPGPAAAPAKSERLLARGRVERLALTYYRTGGLITGSNARLKLATMGDRLLLRENSTAMLILSVEDRPGETSENGLAAFRKAIGPVDEWMDRIARLR